MSDESLVVGLVVAPVAVDSVFISLLSHFAGVLLAFSIVDAIVLGALLDRME